ncbi:hypothetical protein BH10BAC5_BH10BAC5_26750 [soil metagenome]
MSYQNEEIMYQFQALFHSAFGRNVNEILKLRADASERKIYRLKADNITCIGIYNRNIKENKAFISFSGSFFENGFKVPQILGVNADSTIYLESDIGNTTVYKYVNNESSREKIISAYSNCLSELLKFQFKGLKLIETEYCFEGKEFNEKLIQKDINKFCDYCIKEHTNIEPAIIRNSEGIKDLVNEIMKTDMTFFMYRDFQPRNIMIVKDELFFIDYQAGRKGPLQYDAASFLYSGSIEINKEEREFLLSGYLKEMEDKYGYSADEFRKSFYLFVFIRLIQVLGSYGYTYNKRKEEIYLKKMGKALENLKSIKDNVEMKSIRELIGVLTGG